MIGLYESHTWYDLIYIVRNFVKSEEADFHRSIDAIHPCHIHDSGKCSDIADTRGSVGICDHPIFLHNSCPRVLFQESGTHAIIMFFIFLD